MSAPPRPPRRILLIQLRRLGDVLLSTPLLIDLNRAFPAARLDWLVGDAAAPLLDGHPLITERIVYDRTRTAGMWMEIRRRRYDWIVDVQSNPRTALLTRLSGAPVRVGWDVRGWGWVYTHRLTRSRLPEWVVRERQRLLELVGVPVAPNLPTIALTAAERAAGAADAAALGLGSEPRVGLLMAAGERSKEWSVEQFADLAGRLASEGIAPLVFRDRSDDTKADRLASLESRAVIAPALPLRRFLGLLATCRVFVSSDTGPAHMAAALGVPTVTFFGPSLPASWSPGLPTTIALREEHVPCLGCRLNVCPIGHDCMRDLSPARVASQVHALLALPRDLPAVGAPR